MRGRDSKWSQLMVAIHRSLSSIFLIVGCSCCPVINFTSPTHLAGKQPRDLCHSILPCSTSFSRLPPWLLFSRSSYKFSISCTVGSEVDAYTCTTFTRFRTQRQHHYSVAYWYVSYYHVVNALGTTVATSFLLSFGCLEWNIILFDFVSNVPFLYSWFLLSLGIAAWHFPILFRQ